MTKNRFHVITVAAVLALTLFALEALAGPFAPAPRRPKTQVENEELCDQFGDSLERKFASNPKDLVRDLDELIVKVGSRGPDRVSPQGNGGRMLASLSGPPAEKETRKQVSRKPSASLDVRVYMKLTEANKLIKQTKRLGFFDEDEERSVGVQEACAKVVHERAVILERMTRQ